MNNGLRLIVLIGCVFLLLYFMDHFLFMSTDAICNSMLQHTPIGAAREDVALYISQEGWEIDPAWQEAYAQRGAHECLPVSGRSFIVVRLEHLGGYAHDDIFWGFDAENRLADVGVKRVRKILNTEEIKNCPGSQERFTVK